MRKEAGWQWYPSIGLPSRYSRCNFQTNRCRPHPVRGLKLPSEPCFCHLQPIIVSQRREKNCWRHLNKFWEIFYDCKTTIRSCSMQTSRLFTKEDGWFGFLLVWRIFGCASTIIAMTLSSYSDVTNISEVPLPKHQTSRRLKRIMIESRFFTALSNIGEDVHCTICFN